MDDRPTIVRLAAFRVGQREPFTPTQSPTYGRVIGLIKSCTCCYYLTHSDEWCAHNGRDVLAADSYNPV